MLVSLDIAILLVGVAVLRILMESTSSLGFTAPSRRLAPVGGAVAAVLLAGVFHDTDVYMVTYEHHGQ